MNNVFFITYTNCIVNTNERKKYDIISNMFRNSFVQLIWGIYVRLAFVFISSIYFFIFLIIAAFTPKRSRPLIWRLGVKLNNAHLLRIARVKLVFHNKPDISKKPCVIVSNHPTILDGIVYFSVFGPNVIPLTGPSKHFNFPFGTVFKKMGAISVRRDKNEDLIYKTSIDRKKSVRKMIDCVRNGFSLLIFPEGRVERTKKLYYIHTGAARVSISAKVKVALFGILGGEKIFIDKIRMRPGILYINFDKFISPPKPTRDVPFGALVRPFANKIKKEFVSFLPSKYIPNYIEEKHTDKIAAFIDIDGTVYNGISQKDCIEFLLKKNVIAKYKAFPVFLWLTLEKCGLITHNKLHEKAMRIMNGISVKRVARLCSLFFKKHGRYKLFDRMIPIIKNHQEEGHHIVFVSEIIEPLAREFAEFFGVNDVIATQMEKKNKKYTGRVNAHIYGETKRAAIELFAHKNNIDLKKSYAYSDSISDKAMLMSVQNPFVVNPDKKLRDFAKKLDWSELE